MTELDSIVAERDEDKRHDAMLAFVVRDPDGALRHAQPLLQSPDPLRRELGADLLGQVAPLRRDRQAEISQLLISAASGESEPSVLQAIGIALGHNADARTATLLRQLARHESEDVRYAAAFSLSKVSVDPETISTLIALTRDTDRDVRDWATFSLATSESNEPETIAALLARTEDDDDETRGEAIYGLAMRGDARAKALIERELQRPSHSDYVERAAEELDMSTG